MIITTVEFQDFLIVIEHRDTLDLLAHNYAYNGRISLETMKLWLLVMTKTFINDQDYKADIGQHFHKSEKIR